jgi:hypothetical protein
MRFETTLIGADLRISNDLLVAFLKVVSYGVEDSVLILDNFPLDL